MPVGRCSRCMAASLVVVLALMVAGCGNTPQPSASQSAASNAERIAATPEWIRESAAAEAARLGAHEWSRKRDGQIAQQLRTIVSVAYTRTPLRQVIADLARRGRFPAMIDEQGVMDEEIAPDSHITFTLQNASIETVLGLILREPLRLEWVVRNGHLVITTQTMAHHENLGSTESVRVFDVGRLRELEFQAITRWLRPHGEFSNGFEHPWSPREDEWYMLDSDAPVGTELFGLVEMKPFPMFRAEASMSELGEGPGGRSWAGQDGPYSPGHHTVAVLSHFIAGGWGSEGRGFHVPTMQFLGDALAVRERYHQLLAVQQLLEALEAVGSGKLPRGSIEVRPPGYPRARDNTIRTELSKPVDSIAFKRVPLRTAIAAIATRFDVPIIVSEQSLIDEGIDPDSSVTVELDDINGHAALRQILNPLKCISRVRDGVVHVTARTAMSRFVMTKVYDVADLWDAGIAPRRLRTMILEATAQFQEVDGATDAWIEFWTPGVLCVGHDPVALEQVDRLLVDLRERLDTEADRQPFRLQPTDPARLVKRIHPISKSYWETQADWDKRVASLVESIPIMVAPSTWRSRGGRGEIRQVGHTIVIAQSREVQRQLGRYIRNLDSSQPSVYPDAPADEWPPSTVSDPVDSDFAEDAPQGVPPINQNHVAELAKRLLRTVSVDYSDTPLNTVIADLGTRGGFPVRVVEQDLVDEGIRLGEPITLKLADVSIQTVLQFVLRPIALTWGVHNRTLLVTTETGLQSPEWDSTGVFDIRRQLEWEFAANKPWLVRRSEFSSMIPPRPSRSQKAFVRVDSPLWHGYLPQLYAPGDDLVSLIRNSLGGFWQNNQIVISRSGTLLVRSGFHDLRVLEQLLTGLESVVDGDVPKGAISIRRPGYPHLQDREVRERLTRAIDSISFRRRPLRNALSDIANRLDVPVLLNEFDLADELVETDEPITLELADSNGLALLDLVLSPIECTSHVNHGVVCVTTRSAASAKRVTVVHDVSDLRDVGIERGALVELISSLTSGPWFDIDGAGAQVLEGWLPGVLVVGHEPEVLDEVCVLLADLRTALAQSGRIKPSAGKADLDPNRLMTRYYPVQRYGGEEPGVWARRVTETVASIPALVEPKAWRPGGGKGAVRQIARVIVVRQTAAVHRQVPRYLRDLRINRPFARFGDVDLSTDADSEIVPTPSGGV